MWNRDLRITLDFSLKQSSRGIQDYRKIQRIWSYLRGTLTPEGSQKLSFCMSGQLFRICNCSIVGSWYWWCSWWWFWCGGVGAGGVGAGGAGGARGGGFGVVVLVLVVLVLVVLVVVVDSGLDMRGRLEFDPCVWSLCLSLGFEPRIMHTMSWYVVHWIKNRYIPCWIDTFFVSINEVQCMQSNNNIKEKIHQCKKSKLMNNYDILIKYYFHRSYLMCKCKLLYWHGRFI